MGCELGHLTPGRPEDDRTAKFGGPAILAMSILFHTLGILVENKKKENFFFTILMELCLKM